MKADRGEFVRSTQKAAEASEKFFAAFIESSQGFEKVFETIIASAEDETDKNGAIDALAKVKKVTAALKTDSEIPVQYTVYLEVRRMDLAEMKEVPFTKKVKIEGSNKISEEKIIDHPSIYRVSRSATDESPLRISVPGYTIRSYNWREPGSRKQTDEDKARWIERSVEILKADLSQLNIAVTPHILTGEDPTAGITDTATFKNGVITVRRGDKEEKIDLTEEKKHKRLDQPAKIAEAELYDHFKSIQERASADQEIMIAELGLTENWMGHQGKEFLWEPEILILVIDVVKSESIPEGVPVAPQVSTDDEPSEAPATQKPVVQPDGASALELSFYTSVQQLPNDNLGHSREYIQNTVPFTLDWYGGEEDLPKDYDFKKAGTTQENVTGSARIFLKAEVRAMGRLFIEAEEHGVKFKVDHDHVIYPSKGEGEDFANSAYIDKIGDLKLLRVQVKHDDVVDVEPEEAPAQDEPSDDEVAKAAKVAEDKRPAKIVDDLTSATGDAEGAETAGQESGLTPETTRFFQSEEEDKHLRRLLELVPKLRDELLELSQFHKEPHQKKEFTDFVQSHLDKIEGYLDGENSTETQKDVIIAMRELLLKLFRFTSYVLNHARAPLELKRTALAKHIKDIEAHTANRDLLEKGSDERKAATKLLSSLRSKRTRAKKKVEELTKNIERLTHLEKEIQEALSKYTATFKTTYPGIELDIIPEGAMRLDVDSATRKTRMGVPVGETRHTEGGRAEIPVPKMEEPEEPLTQDGVSNRLAALRASAQEDTDRLGSHVLDRLKKRGGA